MSEGKPSTAEKLAAAGEKIGQAGDAASKAGNNVMGCLFWGFITLVLGSCLWGQLFGK